MKKLDFEGIEFRGEFRNYQRKVLDEAVSSYADRRIHIVAAPGSGKTILGLELIRWLGKPALVLSPTIVIADQWGERFSERFLPDDEVESDYISDDLKKPELITSITYQALYSAWNRLTGTEAASDVDGTDEAESDVAETDEAESVGETDEGECDVAETDEAECDVAGTDEAESVGETDEGTSDATGAEESESPVRTDEAESPDETDEAESADKTLVYDFSGFDPVACVREAGIKTICLDEAHHLKREWQKALEAFISAVSPDISIIALTATPPYDSSESEWQRYVSLCGEIDTEIFVPELVAQKTLCPHQDYIMFNYPTEAEKGLIFSHRQSVADCMGEALRSGLFAAAAVRANLVGDILPPEDQLYRYAKEYISFAVCATRSGLPPSEIIIEKLMQGRPLPEFDLDHLQRAFAFVAENNEVFGEELAEQMIGVCRRFRLAPRKKLLLADNSRVGKALFSSLGKLGSIAEIAREEYRRLGGKLRLVVLTDNIRKDFVAAIGTDEPVDAIGAVPIFEVLRRALPLEARVGMLSGSLVIWPIDRIAGVREIASLQGAEFSYAEIVHRGIPGISLPALPGEDQARYAALNFSGNRRVMISVLTEAFQAGEVEAIVGTKALLGEGWDSPCINSLILASFVGSYVLSNQMRGRAIRTDKNDPGKTANIWHLVALEPSFASEEKATAITPEGVVTPEGKASAITPEWVVTPEGKATAITPEEVVTPEAGLTPEGAASAGVKTSENAVMPEGVVSPEAAPSEEAIPSEITATPEISSQGLFPRSAGLNSEDYKLMERRFKMFFGPAYRGGTISNSIDRIDIIEPPFDEAGIQKINNEMKRLAADREGMARTWAESLGTAPAPRVADVAFVPKESHLKTESSIVVRNGALGATGIAVFLGLAGINLAPFGAITAFAGTAPALILTSLSAAIMIWLASRAIRVFRRAFSPDITIRAMIDALFETMKAYGHIKSPQARVMVSTKQDSLNIVCSLENAPIREQNLFGDAVAELFSPIADPRYVIVRFGRNAEGFEPRWSFAVPKLLGMSAPALDLAERISKRFGKCLAVYTHTESGYRLLHKCRAMSFVNFCASTPKRKFLVIGKH